MKIKKILAVLLSIAIMLSTSYIGNFTSFAFDDLWPEDYESGTEYTYGELTYTYEWNNSVTIIRCNTSARGKITIPSYIDGYPVIAIASEAFYGCSSMTGIEIPSTIENIGYSAFDGCSSLTGVYITDLAAWCNISFDHYGVDFGHITSNPLTMANKLYINNSLATNIAIPSSVTRISAGAFANCSSMQSVTIPSSVKIIERYAFSGCTYLSKVYASDLTAWCNIEFHIEDHSEYYMEGYDGTANPLSYADDFYVNNRLVTSLIIPNSITTIKEGTFYGWENLNDIIIPDSVTSIARMAFMNTGYYENAANWENGVLYIGNHLIDATYKNEDYYPGYESEITPVSGEYCIKEGTLTIADEAFRNCNSLTSITIPDSVIHIGEYAFYECDSLKNVVIGNSVTSINRCTFCDCDKLSYLTIPKSVKYIYDYAFEYCNSIVNIYYTGNEEEWEQIEFEYSWQKSDLERANIYYDYSGHSFNEWITLTAATCITAGEEHRSCSICGFKETSVIDALGHSFSTDDKDWTISTAPTCCGAGEKYTTCVRVGCEEVKKETISALGHSYTPVVTPPTCITDGYTTHTCHCGESYVDSYVDAFDGSDVKKHKYNANKVGNSLHYFCTVCDATLKKELAFEYEILNGKITVTNCNTDFSGEIIIPAEIDGITVTAIADFAFSGCKNLTSITLPKSITAIGKSSFASCNNISEIYYYGTRYDWSKIDIAFGNQKLHGAKINYTYSSPSTGLKIEWKEASSSYYDNYRGYFVTGIGTCTDTELVLPSTYEGYDVIGITESAFEGNENITSVYIPSTIHYIDKRAFANCKNLVSAEVCGYINDNGHFSDRGYAVFNGCSSLEFFYTVDVEIETEYANGYSKYCPIGFWFGGYYENSTACTQYYYDTNTATIKNATYYFPNSLKTIQLGGYNFESYTGWGYTYAFAGCTTISKVILEYGISTIPNYTFYRMGGLENIIIPNSVKTIGSSAFDCYNCDENLQAIVLPNSITNIGSYAFDDNDLFNTIYYYGTKDEWDNIQTATNNEVLTNATVYYMICSCGGEFGEWNVTKQANCITEGSKYRTCNLCGYVENKVIEFTEHLYDNACDTICNTCSYSRSITHTYTNACDTQCNVCGYTRTVNPHTYSYGCDTTCNICGYIRTASPHVYTNSCDTTCNVCSSRRSITHTYDNACDEQCDICGYTRTITHVYNNACDTTCNICGSTRTTSHKYKKVVVNPTCIEQGYTTYTCSVCGDNYSEDFVQKLGHRITVVHSTNASNYPFEFKNGIYNSTNKTDSSSSKFTLKALRDCSLEIQYKTSTESNYDKLKIYHNSKVIVTASGTEDTTWKIVTIKLQTDDNVYINYSKDGSISSGNDTVYFKFEPHLSIEDYDFSCEENVICDICKTLAKPAANHFYDNACDTTCNNCSYMRTTTHIYDNTCDSQCNICGSTREISHNYTQFTKENTCVEQGYTMHTCTVCGDSYTENHTEPTGIHNFENGNCIMCNGYLESEHNYPVNFDKTWVIKRENTTSITITFSNETFVEEDWDFIYIYDANDKPIGDYTGSDLSGKSITINGNTVKIRLFSDRINTAYGFKITDISVQYSVGDINGDGKTDLKDIVRLKKILAGLDDSEGASPDIDSNGKNDSVDLNIFRKYLLGLIANL